MKNYFLKITWIFASCSYRRPPQLKTCPSSSQSLVHLNWAAATAEILLDKFNSQARRGLISEAHLFCSDKENFLSLQFRSAVSISVPKATQLNTLHLFYSSNARHSPILTKKTCTVPRLFLTFVVMLSSENTALPSRCSWNRLQLHKLHSSGEIASAPPAISCCHTVATQIMLLSCIWVKKKSSQN